MAVPTKLSWALAKELWFKGLTTDAIELQTGIKAVTVRKRASREKWKLEQHVNVPVVQESHAAALKALADRAAAEVAGQTESLLLTLRDMGKPESYREAKDYALALSTTYAATRKSCGVDDTQVQRHLHVHVMREARQTSIVLDAEAAVEPATVAADTQQTPANT